MDTERIHDISINFDKEKINQKQTGTGLVEDKLVDSTSKPNSSAQEVKLPTTKLPRCQLKSCNKRIGYTGYPCHCGQTFCATHRFAKEHNCTHDYKITERAQLAKKNGNVGLEHPKVTKI